MKRKAYGLLLALLIPAATCQARNPEMVVAHLATCDGTNWSGLTLGKTTVRDIKKQYKTGRSDLPMSQELSQPRESHQKIFALFADKHDDSVLAAFLLRYSDNGPNLADLSRAAGVPEHDYYQSGRLENWKLAAFPSKGIVAFELTMSGQEMVPMVILCPPSSVAAVCRRFRTSVQPIVERIDPHANEPRIMNFGTASVQKYLKGLDLNDGERQNVERTMIDTTAGGTMRYVVGSPGSYVTEIRGDFTPDKGGSLTVTSTISGFGPYGFLSGTGSSYKSLPSLKDQGNVYNGVNSTNYTIALYEALEKASQSFRDAMINSGPPPIQSIRDQQWQQLVEALRDRSQIITAPVAEAPPVVHVSVRTPSVHVSPTAPPASFQSLITFANGAQTVGTMISFDGSTYTVSTPKGMRQFKAAAIKSIQALAH